MSSTSFPSKALQICSRLLSPGLLAGSKLRWLPSESVTALLIFQWIFSAESERRIRERWLGSLLDIFFSGLTRDMILGNLDSTQRTWGKKLVLNCLLKRCENLLVSSMCCSWSTPTGTWVARQRRMSTAIRMGQLQRPTLLFSWAFYLYWIMVLSQCWGPRQLKIQVSSQWAGT